MSPSYAERARAVVVTATALEVGVLSMTVPVERHLADAAHAGDVVRRLLDVSEHERWNGRRGRQRVLHQRAGQELARRVVDDLFVERAADALRDRALHLALDD